MEKILLQEIHFYLIFMKNIRILRMDFYNRSVIGEPLVIPRPSSKGKHLEEYSFDRRRSMNMPPSLSSMDLSAGPTGITISFVSGTDDEFVHHYEVTLSRNGSVLATKKILADFYKHPLPSEMKTSWTVQFTSDGLPEGFESGKYTVSLKAYDSWDAASETLVKEIEL